MGKWHLGGLRPTDIAARRGRPNNRCAVPVPGPTQHGFHEYVAMSEGEGSHRFEVLAPTNTLYHSGSSYLLKNDKPLPQGRRKQILTDRQTDEAIRIMNETVRRDQPFYLHLWYDAPHGPYETISPYDTQYKASVTGSSASHTKTLRKMWGLDADPATSLIESKPFKYATMVSSLDANIGRIRAALRSMGIERNTIVVFTSDNGPEDGAGSSGGFVGRKRSLREGGIR